MTSIQPDTEQITAEFVPYIEDVAETIREDALAQARTKLSPFQRDLTLEQLLQDGGFVDYFKYGLASGIANVLAANDQRVRAVYTYDPSANPGNEMEMSTSPDMTVHLIVEVITSSAALENFIDSLDQALVRSLGSLPSPLVDRRAFIIDPIIVTEEDVRLRIGYAVLLQSMFAPALKIWERDG